MVKREETKHDVVQLKIWNSLKLNTTLVQHAVPKSFHHLAVCAFHVRPLVGVPARRLGTTELNMCKRYKTYNLQIPQAAGHQT